MLAQSYAVARTARPPLCPAQPDRADEIKLIGVTKAFGREELIFDEGDRCDFVYKVVSGAVRRYRLLADGRRQITDFYLPGDLFGVECGATRGAAAEALAESVVVMARRSTLAQDADQAARLWRQALVELQRSQDHALTLGRRTASERVAAFLLELAERTQDDDGVTLPMSRQDIADYLGLTIETVSRTLTQFQAQGLIELQGCRRARLARPTALADLCI